MTSYRRLKELEAKFCWYGMLGLFNCIYYIRLLYCTCFVEVVSVSIMLCVVLRP
jgi:hypothetical protein